MFILGICYIIITFGFFINFQNKKSQNNKKENLHIKLNISKFEINSK